MTIYLIELSKGMVRGNIWHTVGTQKHLWGGENICVLSFPEVGTLMISLCFTPKSLVAKGSVSLKFTVL